jgi:glycosyltransferase involved in cell wall biosynthesis
MLTLHVLGLAHTKTSKVYQPCAYTQKVRKLCQMMTERGYTVIHYGAEGSDPVCAENVQVISDDLQRQVYGEYDWTKEMFKCYYKDPAYEEFNRNAIREVRLRAKPGDFLLIPMGLGQKAVADALPDVFSVEMGIGYNDPPYAKARVYESYAWMNYQLGRAEPKTGADFTPKAEVDFYTTVIPNFFDPSEFEFSEKKDDYFLFIGRKVPKKGVAIAIETTRKIGAKLKVVGQGTLAQMGLKADHVEEMPAVTTPKERSDLMKNARAVFVPTLYLGPFEGVAVEAMFCGTPVITTDFGVFAETVPHGQVGFRCTSMSEFQKAAENIWRIKPAQCRIWAERHYSMAVCSLQYDIFFKKLAEMEAEPMNWLKTWQTLGASLVSEKVLPIYLGKKAYDAVDRS